MCAAIFFDRWWSGWASTTLRMLAGATISAGPRAAQRRAPGQSWEALVAGSLSGDATATRALLRGIGPRVLATVRRVLGFGALANDAEDIVQESLLAVVSALGSLREPSKVVGFATRTAVRRALRHRKQADAKSREVELESAGPLTDKAKAPDADLVARQRAALLLQLLDELPDAQSEALALRFCLGHSLAEVAEIMQCPVNTVRSRVRLGREALAAKLEKRTAARTALEVDR